MSECTHIWMLDHKRYFDREYHNVFRLNPDRIYFPAKCYICDKQHQFNEDEWLKHLKEQGVFAL